MSEVGALIVKLTAETAQFREDMGKVKSELDSLKPSADGAGGSIKGNMTSSRESVMLLGEEVGVHMPRALSMFVSKLPGVAAAMEMAFPIIGIIAVIGIIGKLIEHQGALAAATRKAAEEAEDQAIKGADQVKSLELTNLKLDDQIAKLEHKPSHNYLKEAILETSEEVDKLAEGYAGDFQKMDGYLTEHTTKWERLKRVLEDAWSGQGQSEGYGAATQAMWDVQAAMEKVTDARRKMADAPMDQASQTAATSNLSAALHDQLTAMDKAVGTAGLSTEALVKLKSSALETDTEMKALYLTLEEGGKKRKIAGLEQSNANNEPLKQEAALAEKIAAMYEKQDAAVRTLQQAKAQAALAAKGGNEIASINAARDAEIAAVQAELAAKDAANQKAMAAAAGDSHLRKEAEVQHVADAYEAASAIAQINQSADDKVAAAARTTAAALLKITEESISGQLALTNKLAEQQEKTAQETLKYSEQRDKQDLAANEASVNAAVAHETMSWRQAQAAKIGFIEAERDAKIKALSDEEAATEKSKRDEAAAAAAAAQAELGANGGDRSDPKYLAYLNQQKVLLAEIDALQKKLGQDSVLAWNEGGAAIKAQQNALAPLQTAMKKVQNEVNQDFAKMVVEGKSFGAAMRQMGAQLLEQMISFEIKRMENFVMARIRETAVNAATKSAQTATNISAGMTDIAVQTTQDKTSLLSSAEKAAGKAWASAPNPIIGAIEATAAFIGVMAFETGGKIPGAGAVPIIGHGGETVIQKSLTDRVERAESWGGGKGSGGQHNWSFSPTVHAMDAEGVDRVLAKHSSVFQRHVVQIMRRMNK
jgi:hypothetical protein